MDYKEKAQHLAETIAGLGFTTASESAARSALTEAHAAGVSEGEANYKAAARSWELRAEEAEAKLYDTEVKRGQDIMEFEREKKALTAELAEANEKLADKSREADQMAGIVGDAYKTGRHDGMGELAKLTAENQRMREALMKIMTWWPTVSFARMTLLIDPVQVCREALAPTEKPAPDGEGRKEKS